MLQPVVSFRASESAFSTAFELLDPVGCAVVGPAVDGACCAPQWPGGTPAMTMGPDACGCSFGHGWADGGRCELRASSWLSPDSAFSEKLEEKMEAVCCQPGEERHHRHQV